MHYGDTAKGSKGSCGGKKGGKGKKRLLKPAWIKSAGKDIESPAQKFLGGS